MDTLSPGGKTTVLLPALNALTVVATGGGSVVRLNEPGGEPFTPTPLVSGDTKAFGPFSTSTIHRVECVTGAITITMAPSDFPSVSSDVGRIELITQAGYDALATPVATTLYLVPDA